jgi:hypothetical protein
MEKGRSVERPFFFGRTKLMHAKREIATHFQNLGAQTPVNSRESNPLRTPIH